MNNFGNIQHLSTNYGNNNQSNFFQNNYNQNINFQNNCYQNYPNNNYNQININNQIGQMNPNNQMNFQNCKQMDQNQKAYINSSNNNQNKNYTRNIYPIKIQNNTNCTIEKVSEYIDRNETNAIKNIIQLNLCNYKYLVDKNISLSDSISDNIKRKLGGEWFVFVFNKNKSISLNLSSITENDFLIFNIGNERIKIARIK